MKFKVRIFMGDKEITHEELKNYVIKGNNTIDRIVNSIVDRAIVTEDGEVQLPELSRDKNTA